MRDKEDEGRIKEYMTEKMKHIKILKEEVAFAERGYTKIGKL